MDAEVEKKLEELTKRVGKLEILLSATIELLIELTTATKTGIQNMIRKMFEAKGN